MRAVLCSAPTSLRHTAGATQAPSLALDASLQPSKVSVLSFLSPCIHLCQLILAQSGGCAQGFLPEHLLLHLQHVFPLPGMLMPLLQAWGWDSPESVSSQPGQTDFLLLQLSLHKAEAVTWEGPIHEQGGQKD